MLASLRHTIRWVLLAVALAAAALVAVRRHRSAPAPRRQITLEVNRALSAHQYRWLEAETFDMGPGWEVRPVTEDVPEVAGDGYIFPYTNYECLSPAAVSDKACLRAIRLARAGSYIAWVRCRRTTPAEAGPDSVTVYTTNARGRVQVPDAAGEQFPPWQRLDVGRLEAGDQQVGMVDGDGLATAVDCLLLTDDAGFQPARRFANPSSEAVFEGDWVDLQTEDAVLLDMEAVADLPAGTSVALQWFSRHRAPPGGMPAADAWLPLSPGSTRLVSGAFDVLGREFAWRARLATADLSSSPTLQRLRLTYMDPGDVGVRIAGCRNGRPTLSRFPFVHQSTDERQLQTLRTRYDLDGVVRGLPSEFARMIALRHWARSRFEPGVPSPYPPWDALVILRWTAGGQTGGFCAQYTQIFVQACLAMGWTARYVGLYNNREAGRGHMATEVWSNDFGRWVAMDPSYDIHYEREGVPLTALGLHRAWVNGDWKSINVCSGPTPHPGVFDIGNEPYAAIDYYQNFNVYLRNNHLSVPLSAAEMDAARNGRQLWSLNFVDHATTRRPRFGQMQSDRESDFYWPLNQTYVSIVEVTRQSITVRLSDNMPNASHYEVTCDDRLSEVRQPELTVPLRGAETHLELRAVNQSGVRGPASTLDLAPCD